MLLVRGHGKDHARGNVALVGIAVGVAVGGSLFLARNDALPFMSSSALPSWLRPSLIYHFSVITGTLAAYFAHRHWLGAATGMVAFYEDRIVFSKHRVSIFDRTSGFGEVKDETLTVPWSDVTGYRDDADEHVTLLVRRHATSPLSIPTLEERDRLAVLELLDRRGMKRLPGTV